MQEYRLVEADDKTSPEEKFKDALKLAAQTAYERLYAVEFGNQAEQFKTMLFSSDIKGFTKVDMLSYLHRNVEDMKLHGTLGTQERYLSTTFYFRDGSCYKFRNTQVGDYLDLRLLQPGISEGLFLRDLKEYADQTGYCLF